MRGGQVSKHDGFCYNKQTNIILIWTDQKIQLVRILPNNDVLVQLLVNHQLAFWGESMLLGSKPSRPCRRARAPTKAAAPVAAEAARAPTEKICKLSPHKSLLNASRAPTTQELLNASRHPSNSSQGILTFWSHFDVRQSDSDLIYVSALLCRCPTHCMRLQPAS